MTATIPTLFNTPQAQTFGPRPKVNEMTLSNEWRNRPAEDVCNDFADMLARARYEKANSSEREYAPRALTIAADTEGSDALALVTPKGQPLSLTHYAFSQLAGLADFSAKELRKLPAELAADVLAVQLAKRDRRDKDVSLLANTDENTVRALTGEQYTRLWSADLLEMTQSAMERGGRRYVTPPAWDLDGRFAALGRTWVAGPNDVGPWTRVQLGDVVRPAGLYYSPHEGRDTFAFFLNTEAEIDLPRGSRGYRFMMLWNSESGAASIGAAMGLVDVVCGNHILWNLRDLKEFRFRHVGEGLTARSHRELLSAFGALDAAPWESKILAASSDARLGDTVEEIEAAAVRATRLPLSTIQAARAKVSGRDYGAPASPYAVASAITEYSQTLRVEDRVDLDRAAAKLYTYAAA